MLYTKLGASGLVVSKLCFGTMTFGSEWEGPLSAFGNEDAKRLVFRALNSGINFFDTADVYHRGESETMLGKALRGHREDVVIATKAGMRFDSKLANAGLSAGHIHRSIEASLARLDTDHVDLYICHRPDPLTPLEETLSALDQIVRSGKARYLGFSNWPAWLAAKAVQMQRANGMAPFINGQMYYSLIARDIEAEFVPMARDCGIGTVVWSPLSSGFLTGKYTRDDPDGNNGRLANMDLLPFDRERGYRIVDTLSEIAAVHDTPIAAVALAWLLARDSVASIILGFTSERQFDENIAAAQIRLTEAEIQLLDTVSAGTLPYPQSFIAKFDEDARAVALRFPERHTA